MISIYDPFFDSINHILAIKASETLALNIEYETNPLFRFNHC